MNAKIISKIMYLSSLVQPLEQLFAFVLYKICTAYQLRLNALKSHIAHIPYTFSRRIEKWIAWKEGEREKSSTNRETMMLYRYAYKYEIRKAIKSVWNVTKENSRATYYGVVFDVIRIRFDSVDFIFFIRSFTFCIYFIGNELQAFAIILKTKIVCCGVCDCWRHIQSWLWVKWN